MYLIDYAELEYVLRRLLRNFTAGFLQGDWKIISRLSPAIVKVDKSPHVAQIVRVITAANVWNMLGALISLVHTAVTHNQRATIEVLRSLIVENV